MEIRQVMYLGISLLCVGIMLSGSKMEAERADKSALSFDRRGSRDFMCKRGIGDF